MNIDELKEKLDKSTDSYVTNEQPYKYSIEESSGFRSGVSWALKKLHKWNLLNIDEIHGEEDER